MKNIVLFVITVAGYFGAWWYLGGAPAGTGEYVFRLGILALLSAPFNIGGTVWTVAGNAESEKDVYALLSFYQCAGRNAVTLFGIPSYQIAGGNALALIGVALQDAKGWAMVFGGAALYQEAAMVVTLGGVSFYQHAEKEAETTVGVSFYQKAGLSATTKIGLAFYQSLTGVSSSGMHDVPKSRAFGVFKTLSYS